MGKNRSSGSGNPPVGEIDNMRTPNNPTKHMIDAMGLWQSAVISTPEGALDDEEIQYIKEHMRYADFDSSVHNGRLTRVEKSYHFLDGGFEEGDVLSTSSVFRAFSREPDGTAYYMRDHFFRGESLVIYRTIGHVPHYNITEHTEMFIPEKESWVETGKLRVDNITRYNNEDGNIMEHIQENLSLGDYPQEIENFNVEIEEELFRPPEEVIFVDLSPV